jgi:signal transduction histidine kinase
MFMCQSEPLVVVSPYNLFVAWIVMSTAAAIMSATSQSAALESWNEGARSRSLFAAKMSHELRTPLFGIAGCIDVLRTTGPDEETMLAAENCCTNLHVRRN